SCFWRLGRSWDQISGGTNESRAQAPRRWPQPGPTLTGVSSSATATSAGPGAGSFGGAGACGGAGAGVCGSDVPPDTSVSALTCAGTGVSGGFGVLVVPHREGASAGSRSIGQPPVVLVQPVPGGHVRHRDRCSSKSGPPHPERGWRPWSAPHQAGHGNAVWWVGRYSSSVLVGVDRDMAGLARRRESRCVTRCAGVVSRPRPAGRTGRDLLTRRSG